MCVCVVQHSWEEHNNILGVGSSQHFWGCVCVSVVFSHWQKQAACCAASFSFVSRFFFATPIDYFP